MNPRIIKMKRFCDICIKGMLNYHSTKKYTKDILLFSDIIEEQSLRDSSVFTVKSDDVGLSPDEGKPVLESQLE